MSSVKFEDLEGTHELSAVDMFDTVVNGEDANNIHFTLDGIHYIAAEDPRDGYRSSLKEITVTRKKPKNHFNPVKVRVVRDVTEEHELLTFFRLRTEHIVMQIGTNRCDDWYPTFIGYFDPKALGTKAKKIGGR